MSDAFNAESVFVLGELVKGKIIQSMHLEEGMNDYLVLTFTDGEQVKILYDYIYEWDIIQAKRGINEPEG